MQLAKATNSPSVAQCVEVYRFVEKHIITSIIYKIFVCQNFGITNFIVCQQKLSNSQVYDENQWKMSHGRGSWTSIYEANIRAIHDHLNHFQLLGKNRKPTILQLVKGYWWAIEQKEVTFYVALSSTMRHHYTPKSKQESMEWQQLGEEEKPKTFLALFFGIVEEYCLLISFINNAQ